MGLEVGTIVEGVVTGLTNFGAFVSLPDNQSGMVHISEVSVNYIKDIKEHLTEGQQVKVKVISIDENGKIGLSIRKAIAQTDKPRRKPNQDKGRQSVWQGQNKEKSSAPMSFEDMMAKFKQDSDEKMSDLKKVTERSRGSSGRRGGRGNG